MQNLERKVPDASLKLSLELLKINNSRICMMYAQIWEIFQQWAFIFKMTAFGLDIYTVRLNKKEAGQTCPFLWNLTSIILNNFGYYLWEGYLLFPTVPRNVGSVLSVNEHKHFKEKSTICTKSFTFSAYQCYGMTLWCCIIFVASWFALHDFLIVNASFGDISLQNWPFNMCEWLHASP